MVKLLIRLTLLLFLIIGNFTVASAQKLKNVYAFTYGQCFNDSVVYVSGVQVIPEAQVDRKTKFLNDRNSYSNQMKKYLDATYGGAHTCAILFDTKRDRVEKKYAKIRRSFQKGKKGKLVELSINEFRLTAVESHSANF